MPAADRAPLIGGERDTLFVSERGRRQRIPGPISRDAARRNPVQAPHLDRARLHHDRRVRSRTRRDLVRPSRHVSTEINDQPSAWARAAKLGVPKMFIMPFRAWSTGGVIGCGTSFFMAQSFAKLRELRAWRNRCLPASEFPTRRSYDTLVALTRSGTTTEVLRLPATLRNGPGPRTVAITADPDTPVVDLADHQVVLDFADEKSIVQTRFATTSLALWRAWLGEDLTCGCRAGRSADRPVATAHARLGPVHLPG